MSDLNIPPPAGQQARRRAKMEALVDRFDRVPEIIQAIVPYEAVHRAMIGFIQGLGSPIHRILEIGVGTGGLTRELLTAFPEATIHGVEVSGKMVDQARQNLSDVGDRLTLEQVDLTALLPTKNTYDLIVSSFTLHRVGDVEKQIVYGRVQRALAPGGVVVIGDLVRSDDSGVINLYLRLWHQDLVAAGMSEREADDRLRDHLAHDRPATLREQLDWLRGLGLHTVDSLWKQRNHVVFFGFKPVEDDEDGD